MVNNNSITYEYTSHVTAETKIACVQLFQIEGAEKEANILVPLGIARFMMQFEMWKWNFRDNLK